VDVGVLSRNPPGGRVTVSELDSLRWPSLPFRCSFRSERKGRTIAGSPDKTPMWSAQARCEHMSTGTALPLHPANAQRDRPTTTLVTGHALP
jgi:hypothetical protein